MALPPGKGPKLAAPMPGASMAHMLEAARQRPLTIQIVHVPMNRLNWPSVAPGASFV